MKSCTKRFLATFLVFIMLVSVLPMTAFAGTFSGEGEAEAVTVYFTLSEDGNFVTGNDKDRTVLARVPVTIEYFDLAEYGLEQYYRYEADSYENGGGYISDAIVEQPTVLHLYIRMLETYYLGGAKLEPGGDALTVSGAATSLYMTSFWGHDQNLMYFVDHAYPLMGPGWGATADYLLLEDGMEIDVAMFSNWSFWSSGAFAFFDPTSYENIAAGTTLEFQTLKAATSAGMNGESLPSEILSGLTTKVYDSSWREIADLTAEASGDGSFTYQFKNAGTYYVVGKDPNAGTFEADTAPAVATVRVGGGESDYSAYPFDQLMLEDETTQLIDIEKREITVSSWDGEVTLPL